MGAQAKICSFHSRRWPTGCLHRLHFILAASGSNYDPSDWRAPSSPVAHSTNACATLDNGSALRCPRSNISRAMSSVTSRDHPSAVLNADHADRIGILPIADVADHGGLVGVFFVDFAIRAAKLPQVIEDKIGLEIEAWS